MEERNSSPWEWHSSDDQETINRCLNCQQLFCNNCIESKAKKKGLGTGFYAPEEFEILKDLTLSNKQIAEMICRSEESIRKKRYELGIVGYKREKIHRESKYKWNADMDEFVMTHSPKETEAKYGIPRGACALRRHLLKKER